MEREESTTSSGPPQQKEDERGAGGKTRKPFVFVRRPHPYVRPPPQTENDGGVRWWHSASRFISAAPTKLLSSFFSTPLRSYAVEEEHSGSEEVKQDASDDGHEIFYDVQMTRSTEAGEDPLVEENSKCVSYRDMDGENTIYMPSDSTGISEIEQMLEGKTLSREDLDRLTEILQSRIAVQSDVDKCGKRNLNAMSGPKAVVAPSIQEKVKVSDDEKESAHLNRVLGESSKPLIKPTSQDLVGASPIEIAKAYMGTRTSDLGVGSRNAILEEESTPIPASVFLSKSPVPSSTPKSSVCWPGAMVQQSHSYMTPRTERARAGLHTSVRTPYSRPVHSRFTPKLEDGGDRSRNIFSTNLKQLQTPVYGGSQMARTTISSHINGFGSVGPIRRTRRKFRETATPSKGTCLLRPAPSGPSLVENFDACNYLLPMVKQDFQSGASTSSSSKFQPVDAKAPSSVSLITVHPQSIDMAKKILEHLDRTVPTPEKKSAELKLATSWRKSPSSESTTSTVKAPLPDLLVEGSEFQQSSRAHEFDQEKEGRGTSLLNDQPEQRKPDEAIKALHTQILGSHVVFTDIPSEQSAAQNTKLSTESKNTPKFEINRNEVSTRPDDCLQNEKKQSLFQQSGVAGQAFPMFAHSDAVYEKSNGPKKLSTRTFGNKPPLSDISITKPDPKFRNPSDNGFGFTFHVSTSPEALYEPPTPSITPSFSATDIRFKDDEFSYGFGSKTGGHALVFSFPSSSSSAQSDFSTPKFSFGSDKGRISFRSVGA